MEPRLPLQTIERLVDAASARGVSLDRFGPLDRSAGGVKYEQLARMYEQAAHATGDEAFGLKVGESSSPGMYGLLGYLVMNSQSVGDALETIVSFQRIWSSAAGFQLNRGRGRQSLRYWHKPFLAPEYRRQESEQMLATVVSLLRRVTSAELGPSEVRFEHTAPPDQQEYERIFSCTIRFNSPATELTFSRAMLDTPVSTSDSGLQKILRHRAEHELAERLAEEPLLDRVRILVETALLTRGSAPLTDVARKLEVHPRTLQRHLHDCGLNFRQVKHQALTSLAEHLLRETALPLSEIAYRLGFSRSSAFHRAFQRQTGCTPGTFRNRMRTGVRGLIGAPGP